MLNNDLLQPRRMFSAPVPQPIGLGLLVLLGQ